MQQIANLDADKVLVMCTGGQGEPNAALQRMSEGEHKYINLNERDTVIISSSPIPGNEIRYDQISNRLSQKGVHLFRHPTHDLDGCGPLHVSGHARREELREVIQMLKPKFFIPVHGGALGRNYHAELGIQEGLPRNNILLPENGDSFYFTANSIKNGGQVAHGSRLVDQTGSIVSHLVIKDRVMLSQEGFLTVILTIDKKSGSLLTSPDIISRGFIAMRENDELIKEFRKELRRAVQQRFKRVDLDRFKAEIKDFIVHFFYDNTKRTPIVIPVVNVIGGKVEAKTIRSNGQGNLQQKQDQKRFQEMRTRLLSTDQRD